MKDATRRSRNPLLMKVVTRHSRSLPFPPSTLSSLPSTGFTRVESLPTIVGVSFLATPQMAAAYIHANLPATVTLEERVPEATLPTSPCPTVEESPLNDTQAGSLLRDAGNPL
uniref:Uncharacterized protein n=1 Tax=Cacopsylla melanoneura TaxID=428564 RepID=A0A8D8TN10_9HEMI